MSVYADAVLAKAIPIKRLKSIARRRAQIQNRRCGIKHRKFALGN
ncbi:Unknown protein sequence [Pseudomonas syringae pv. cilantro]|uniref:Uncharacterized protein n=1 Tax=Pseudomonas syringae pv. cilantro TaxID=81035 RepID=A0A0N0X8T6_PSESX|nr:Unknown protein sequence [Pseudomonas syringae pv. cilantro]